MRRRAGMTQAELARISWGRPSRRSREPRPAGGEASVGFMERYAWAGGTHALDGHRAPGTAARHPLGFASRGTPIAPGDVVEARAEAAQRIRDTRERVDRGEISVAEYAMERLAAELELAEKQEAPI